MIDFSFLRFASPISRKEVMMSVSRVANIVDGRPLERRNRYSISKPLRVASAAVGAVLLLTHAFMSAPPEVVRADDGPRSGETAQVPAHPANRSSFVEEIRRTLKKQHDRMIDLAKQLIGGAEVPENLEDQVAIQQTRIEAAKASLLSAQLTREIAEIAVTEYEQGIFPQEKATLEAELKLARDELDAARQHVPEAKDRSIRIRITSKGSTADLANEFQYSAQVVGAELEERRAGFAMLQAESRLKTLVEYTKPMRVSQLRSSVEKARSVELAKKTRWNLDQSKPKLKRRQQAIRSRDLATGTDPGNSHDRQALVLLDRALPIEEKLQTKLDELSKEGKSDETRRKEIQNLADQLQALVDQAEIERSAAQFDRLKTRFQSATNR